MNRPPRILLGVSGGIAAYKAVEVLRGLTSRGADVRVAMTRGAREFVAPLTFAVLSKSEVHTEVWGSGNTPAVDHVELARWCDLLLVAPATAHTLGKFAQGLADDFLSTYFLAHRGPVLVAPAMESAMWENDAVRANMQLLASRGVRTIGPESGPLASGQSGIGRMAEPDAIVEEAWRIATGAHRDLAGLRLLVTAGPTREPIDPIRFVSNRSSGKMGYALAEAARDRGASVTLASGPTGLTVPEGMRVLRLRDRGRARGDPRSRVPGVRRPRHGRRRRRLHPRAERAPAPPKRRGEGPAPRARPRPARVPPAAQARPDRRGLRRGDRGSRSAGPPQDGGEGRRPHRRQRRRPRGHRLRRRPRTRCSSSSRAGGRELVSRRGKREVAERILDAFAAARRSQGADRSASTVHLSDSQPPR